MLFILKFFVLDSNKLTSKSLELTSTTKNKPINFNLDNDNQKIVKLNQLNNDKESICNQKYGYAKLKDSVKNVCKNYILQ